MREREPPASLARCLARLPAGDVPARVSAGPFDRDARVCHVRLLIERTVDQFALQCNSLLAALSDKYTLPREEFCLAVDELFAQPPGAGDKLIRRHVPSALRPLSRFNGELVEALLRAGPTFAAFLALKDIADVLPFAFSQLPGIITPEVAEIILRAVDGFAAFYEMPERNSREAEDAVALPTAAAVLLSRLFCSPPFLDAALPGLLARVAELAPPRALVLALRALLFVSTARFVLVALLRAGWASSVAHCSRGRRARRSTARSRSTCSR
jgi:hypothetical protein